MANVVIEVAPLQLHSGEESASCELVWQGFGGNVHSRKKKKDLHSWFKETTGSVWNSEDDRLLTKLCTDVHMTALHDAVTLARTRAQTSAK